MLITCPTCASSYRIDASKIAPEGRSVRCAACRETWFLTPGDAEADEDVASLAGDAGADAFDPVVESAWAQAAASVRESAEPAAEVAAEPEAGAPRPRRRSTKKPPPKRRPFAAARFPISPAAVIGLSALAALPVMVLARTAVVGVVPQTASVFAAIGLPVNRRGLDIRDVVAFQNPAQDDRTAELVVEGDLVGVGRGDAPVPGLTVEITDAAGTVIKSFSAPAPRAILGAGESARFRARLAAPPSQGRAVLLRFAAAAPAPKDKPRP